MTGVTTIYVTGQHDVFVFVFVFVLFVVSVGGPWLPPLLMEWRVRHSPPSAQDTGLAKRGFRARETDCLPRPCRLLKTPNAARCAAYPTSQSARCAVCVGELIRPVVGGREVCW